jgi:serine O-acetyltransferase
MTNKDILTTLKKQLSFFGEISTDEIEYLQSYFNEAYKISIEDIKLYANIPTEFNYLQTHHSSLFLYKFARLLYEKNGNYDLCTKLYLLNRMLNSVDLFFKIKLPKYFLLGHGIGTILSSGSTYGNYLVVFQNSTIGVQNGNYPEIGEKVIIYPNCVIAGKTTIGNNCVIGAGTVLINKNIPDNSIVHNNDSGSLHIKNNDKNLIKQYFNIPFSE